jgi:hypothetical protein
MRLIAREKGFPVGAALGLAMIAGAVAVRLFHLDHLAITLCTFKRITGLPCATCGSTRALGRLAHLDLPGAVSMNPLATLSMLAIAVWAIVDLVMLPRRRSLELQLSSREWQAVGIASAVALVVNWAYLVAAGR